MRNDHSQLQMVTQEAFGLFLPYKKENGYFDKYNAVKTNRTDISNYSRQQTMLLGGRTFFS